MVSNVKVYFYPVKRALCALNCP